MNVCVCRRWFHQFLDCLVDVPSTPRHVHTYTHNTRTHPASPPTGPCPRAAGPAAAAAPCRRRHRRRCSPSLLRQLRAETSRGGWCCVCSVCLGCGVGWGGVCARGEGGERGARWSHKNIMAGFGVDWALKRQSQQSLWWVWDGLGRPVRAPTTPSAPSGRAPLASGTQARQPQAKDGRIARSAPCPASSAHPNQDRTPIDLFPTHGRRSVAARVRGAPRRAAGSDAEGGAPSPPFASRLAGLRSSRGPLHAVWVDGPTPGLWPGARYAGAPFDPRSRGMQGTNDLNSGGNEWALAAGVDWCVVGGVEWRRWMRPM